MAVALVALTACGGGGSTYSSASVIANKIKCTGFLPDDTPNDLFPGSTNVGTCELDGGEVNMATFATSEQRDQALAHLRSVAEQQRTTGSPDKPPIYGSNWIVDSAPEAWETVKDRAGGKSG
jgi:hypothetical protein